MEKDFNSLVRDLTEEGSLFTILDKEKVNR